METQSAGGNEDTHTVLSRNFEIYPKRLSAPLLSKVCSAAD